MRNAHLLVIIVLLALHPVQGLDLKLWLEVDRSIDKGTMNNPSAIAVDISGNVWIADEGNRRILKFSNNGSTLDAFGDKAEGVDLLKSPAGICIDARNLIWVADSDNDKIYMFDYAGEPNRVYGESGSGEGQFHNPHGIVIAKDESIWVADYGNHRVQQLDTYGNVLKIIGQHGTAEGEFIYPIAIALDSKGDVWVADNGNARLQKFSSDGTFLGGIMHDYLKSPSSLAIDRNNNLYVSDIVSNKVLIFDAQGNLHHQFDAKTTALALDVGGNIWTISKEDSLIQQFTPSGAQLTSFGKASNSNSINRHYLVIR